MTLNSDESEINKFSAHAFEWWDENGAFKTLHQINQTRLHFIEKHVRLSGKTILDIGCGGGLLTEAMTKRGAIVSGLDQDELSLRTADTHAKSQNLTINYHLSTAEDFAHKNPQDFDVVTCLEMLEHVPDPASVINAIAKLVKPNGLVFFSTINRNWLSYALAIVAAEYVLNLIPRGTHDYNRLIKPSELDTWARACGLQGIAIEGISYNPFDHTSHLIASPTVNFIAAYKQVDTM